MAFYKLSDSNIQNNEIQEIIQVVHSKTCEQCGGDLDIAGSKGGFVKCQGCGFENSMTENNNG